MLIGRVFRSLVDKIVPSSSSSSISHSRSTFSIIKPLAIGLIFSSLFLVQSKSISSASNSNNNMQQSAPLSPLPPNSATTQGDVTDPIYPGTAVIRMNNIRERVKTLSLDGVDWEEARKLILWAGGLRDIQDKRLVGNGYTGHSFNDWNHCDLTAMLPTQTHLENNNQVAGIHSKNSLGQGILAASLEELGPGGSWSTCLMGCNYDPPRDVAHLQFRARIAFKLVWVPPSFTSFVLVDDDGNLLKVGRPTGELPDIRERANNFKSVGDSKYSTIAKNLQEMNLQNQSSAQRRVTAADVHADGHMKPK